MKKMRKGLLLGFMLLILTFCAGSFTVQAAGTATTATAAKKTGWVTKAGKKYYYVKGKK